MLHLEIQNVRSDDDYMQARVAAYLLSNQHEGVRLRPDVEMHKAFETGQGLIITKDGDLCGCSLIYKFDTGPSGSIHSEIGTMRITQNGLGLQSFLAQFHLMQLHLEEYEDGRLCDVFAVVEPGTASDYILRTHVGMAKWGPPPELMHARGDTGVPFNSQKDVLKADLNNFRSAFAVLNELHRSERVFRAPKEGAQITINMAWFKPEMLQIGAD